MSMATCKIARACVNSEVREALHVADLKTQVLSRRMRLLGKTVSRRKDCDTSLIQKH